MNGKKQREEPDRYAQYWNWTAKLTRAMQNGICAYPGCKNKIWQVHHAVYQRLNEWGQMVPIRGSEKPGIHCFGLCCQHHGRDRWDAAHHSRNWVSGTIPPDYLDAHNTPDYYKLLVKGWEEKTTKKSHQKPKQGQNHPKSLQILQK